MNTAENTQTTQSNATHTPTPFFIDNDHMIIGGSGDSYRTVADPRCMSPDDYAEIDANAAFIVRACNSHADLLQALQVALATIERLKPDSGPFDSTKGTKDLCRSAIARATQP